MLHQIAYVSTAQKRFSTSDIGRVLDQSKRNNAREGITGFLLYHDLMFFQVLEGPKDVVEACYERICDDYRNLHPALILATEIEHRSFPSFSMAYVRPEELELDTDHVVYSLRQLTNEPAPELRGDPRISELIDAVLKSLR